MMSWNQGGAGGGGGAVTSVAGKVGIVTLVPADAGLGNVTNDSQVKRSEMAAASGVATLDGASHVPVAQALGGKILSDQVQLATTVSTGTANPLVLTDAAFSGFAAGGSYSGQGSAPNGTNVTAPSATLANLTGSGAGQAGLGANSPLADAAFVGQRFPVVLKKPNGSDLILSDVLAAQVGALASAKVYGYLGFASDQAANQKWRLWFYYDHPVTGVQTAFAPAISVATVTLIVPVVYTGDLLPAAAGLGVPIVIGDVAAEIGPQSITTATIQDLAITVGKIAAGAVRAWRDVEGVILRDQATQSLAADGDYTLTGTSYLWTKENSSKDSVAMQILNGSGLEIAPIQAGNYTAGQRNTPIFRRKFVDAIPDFDLGMPLKLWMWLRAENMAANNDFCEVCTETSTDNAHNLIHQVCKGWSGQKLLNLISGHSGASDLNVFTATGVTDDVLILELPLGLAGQVIRMSTGVFDATNLVWPAGRVTTQQPTLGWGAAGSGSITPPEYLQDRSTASMVLTALRNSSATAFVAKIGAYRIQTRGP